MPPVASVTFRPLARRACRAPPQARIMPMRPPAPFPAAPIRRDPNPESAAMSAESNTAFPSGTEVAPT